MWANPTRSPGFLKAFRPISKKLDILVNNVGMNILTPSVTSTDPALWDKIIETNLKGTFLTSSAAVPLMKKAGKGKIINISSIAAKKAAMGMGIYCVAKAGVEMLTKVLAKELVQDRITVNGIAPSVVRTDFTRPFWSNESILKEIVNSIPMGRIAETDDIVGTALYLASDLSDFCHRRDRHRGPAAPCCNRGKLVFRAGLY